MRPKIVYSSFGYPLIDIGHTTQKIREVQCWSSSQGWLHVGVTSVADVFNQIDPFEMQPQWLEEIIEDALTRLPEARRREPWDIS